MLGFVNYGIGYFAVTLLIQYMLFKLRKNHNHGTNGIWVGMQIMLKRNASSATANGYSIFNGTKYR